MTSPSKPRTTHERSSRASRTTTSTATRACPPRIPTGEVSCSRMRLGFFTVIVLVGCSQTPPQKPITPLQHASDDAKPTPRARTSVVETALREYQRDSRCSDFDYRQKGGLRTFWCHLPAARASLAVLREASGTDVFKSG